MALTDAQAKIIAENRKKKETEKALAAAAAAKILASSTTKKSPSTILDQRASSRPYSPMLTQQVYRPSGTLKTPLNYLQEAAAQKITTQDRISAAKRSGAVRGDYQRQWQKNKATAVERIAQRRERDSKQTLSEYDSKLPRTAQDRIRSYKTQWGLAKEAGDTAGMKTAHALAEQVRARAGYSGGVTGDEFLTADLTDREKLTLNQVGQNKLKMAKLAQKQAFEAKDAKALQEATEEMARIMSAPGYRNQAAVGDTDAHGRSKMPGSPDAQMDAEQALAILKAAGYGTAGAFAALMESSRKALNSRDPWGVKAAKDKALKNLADYDLMDSDDPQKQQWGRELAAYRKQKEQEELQTWMDDLNAKRLEYLGESYASGLITWEDYQERREELLRETMTDGQWLMYQSQKNLAKAAEGQSMAGQFGTNTLVSGLQQLPGMAAALIPVVGPAVSLAYLGAMAAGQKAYELDQRGIEPGEVFTRSFLSAGVEVLTEKIPLGAMLDIVKKGGGENFLKALGKTLGLNFTEESLAYTGNWLLDKAYEDPEAKFSLAEMAANGLAGALIGGTASVGGAAVMGGGTRKATTPQSASQTAPLAQGSLSGLPQEEAEKKTVLPTAEEAERQQRAAQANTELERSGILAGAEEETIRRVGDLARKLNREVRFFRGESWENGRYDPNTGILHLNTNGRNPIMQIFAHELTHSIETAESYDKLVGAILKTMDDAELNERFQEITQRYQEKGVFLEDPAEVMHEVVAEYVETRLLTNYEDILSLVQTDRSLGQRILEWIDSMLAKLGSTAAQERAALTEAREMYARALQETNEGGATMVPPQTPSSGLTRAPQGAHAQTEGTIPQSASQTAPFAQGSLLEESGPKGEKGWEDLPHDPYMQALGEQLRSGEISEEEFDRRFDEYYHGGSEVFDYDTEETTLPMKYSFADQRRETPPDTGNEDTVFVERSGGYVMSRDEQDSIKEQLRKHQEELGKMKTVATISDNGWRGMSTGAFRKKIVNDLKKTGYRVEKQGVGTIIFDEKLLNRSLNYIETDAEAAAYQALPQVLKRGIEISGHGDHKTRGYETVTIAAPVMLNGIRGNMAVVVMKTKGNRYKVHRVLTPDGETFVLPEKANAVSTSVGGITEAAKTSGAVTPTINTASKFSIPGGREKVKYSISGEGESQTGRTWTREALPAKARDQLDRTERAMVDRLGKAMDVPVKARQTSLREIARELGETYLATGRIDQETADRLFETAWEKGVVEDREYYDQYKPIKDRLRTLPLRISEEDSHDIVDYAHFKKAARGVLRLVKDEGTPVDVAYEEMKQTAPELFPAEITHPADQLVQMYEVARGIQKTEKSLADHYGPEAETYKAYAKNDFCEQVYDAVADWKLVRRYADERAEELEQNAGQVVLVTPEQVKGAWKGLKEDRKAYEKVMAKHLLTDHDKVQVGRLLKGELEPEHLEPGKDNVKGILEVWKAREAYERDRRAIAEWNKGRKDQLRGEADRLLDTANSWKDKKMGLQYAAETMERNIRDIVPDKDLAEEIIQTYFAPVHTAQAESTRLKNRMRQRVKELDLSRKVKNGNLVSEAHAVQLYGEAMDNIQMLKNSRGRMKHRDGKTLQEWESVVTKLWEENPNLDRGKVQRAVEEFRKIYDDLFEQMNEARIRNGYEPTNYRKGYFPHFQPGHTDGITGMFANVLGISTEITALPTTIAGMTHTFKPGIRWFGNAQERLGFNTAYDAVEGFDKYIEGVADVICQTDNIQRLRALASQTRYRTSDEGIRKQVDAVLANESLSDQDKENRIRDIYENGRFALSNFVINLDEYTNLLANKRSLHDRSMEQDFGRKAYNLVRWLEGRVGANMVAINPGSWLTNLIPLTQGGAQLGSGQLMKGMWETLQAYAGKSSQDFVDRSTFLTNRRGSDPLVPRWAELADTNTKPKQVLRKAGEVTGQAGDFLAMGMEYIDNFTADSLVRARYNQNLKRGLSEEAALEEADAWTAGVMADRSKGATPTLFSRTNPGTKLFTQFQLEVNNQLRYLFKDIPRQEAQRGAAFVAGTMLKFFLGAWLYDEVYEYFLGRRPAMDPIGILNDTVGDLTGWELPNLVELGVGAVKGEVPSFQTEKPGNYEAITGAAKEVAGQIPFVGGLLGGGRLPVSNAIPNAGNLLKAATAEDWSPEKRWDTVAKEIWKPLSYVVLPTGGGQIKKVVQGANAVRKGGSYTVDAEGNEILQYPVYGDTPWEMVKSLGQATVFGKTTLPTGKDWVERNFQNLSARETAAYRELTEEMDSDSRTVYETLRAMKAEKDDSGKRSVLAEADLTDREMQVIYNYLFGEKQPEGGYISSRDEDITALAEVGVGMDEFLTIQNQYAAINKMDGNAEAKATAFARWLNTQGYSQEESAAIQGAFRYYYQMPADAARYNEMTASGLDDETAAGIADSLGALEPLEGATQVSNAQKYRVVVDAGISEDKQMEVLGGMMQEAEYTRLQVGRQHGGVAPTEYVQFLELKPLYDEDGNGSFKQAEVTALLKAMNISNSSKAALWQMANKSWKPGKNPFSVDVGSKVYEGLNGG